MTKAEEIEKYNLKLQKYIDNKSFIKISRNICDEEEILSGFILDMSKDFLFLQLEKDFTFDGYAIIRQDDYDSIRHSSYERTKRKIYNAEGLLKNEYGFKKPLPLTDWTVIFKKLKALDYHVIIQNIYDNYLDFNIGPITKVTDKTVSIHYYDPNGQLIEKPEIIKFDTIRIVQFGDRYSTIFRKYLKPYKKK